MNIHKSYNAVPSPDLGCVIVSSTNDISGNTIDGSLFTANGVMVTSLRQDFLMTSFAIFNRVPSKSAIVLILPEISKAYTTPFLSGVCSGNDLCLIEGNALTLMLTGFVLQLSFLQVISPPLKNASNGSTDLSKTANSTM